jgi:hypothetical protein
MQLRFNLDSKELNLVKKKFFKILYKSYQPHKKLNTQYNSKIHIKSIILKNNIKKIRSNDVSLVS